MKYSKEDIKFESISPKSFENLCYDLLVNYNFDKLIWRKGGADNGRDIEGSYLFNNSISNIETKWFFECKHYTKGVPPADLNSKIAWADAENPRYLVFFISSYITTGARAWLEKISPSKNYTIIVIEGDELKNRLLKYPKLIEEYFSSNRYEKLFKDIKDFKTKFNINPSFELLKEIIDNIDLNKLDDKDFSFILLNFYNQFTYFESRNDHYGDFDESIIYPVLKTLKEKVTNTELNTFLEYVDDYSELGGTGLFDEMELVEYPDDDYELRRYNFQHYTLHLNHTKEQDKWKIGEYLFIIFENVAFEIFEVEETQIRIINEFNPEKINQVSLKLSDKIITEYKEYLKITST